MGRPARPDVRRPARPGTGSAYQPPTTGAPAGAARHGLCVPAAGDGYGTPDAARVEIRAALGSLTASLLALKGRPSWGVWYAVVNGPGMSGPDYVRAIRLYDSAGRVVVDQSMS